MFAMRCVDAAIPAGRVAAATSSLNPSFFRSGIVGTNSEVKPSLPRSGDCGSPTHHTGYDAYIIIAHKFSPHSTQAATTFSVLLLARKKRVNWPSYCAHPHPRKKHLHLVPISSGDAKYCMPRAISSINAPAVWDPQSNLPLPTEGELLDTPIGTRIDYIGWTPSQISYCTVRHSANDQ